MTDDARVGSGSTRFEEGEVYPLDELPDSEMTKSGSLEALGDGRYAAKYGDQYVTFEFEAVRCVDVRSVEEVKEGVR